MVDIEPIVFPVDHPGYLMAQSLIKIYADESKHLARRPSVYLLARSPISPVSKMIWSHLPALAAIGCPVYVIFHKRQHHGSARRAAQMYRDAFGERLFSHVRLADFREMGNLYETLQMGPIIAWAGGRMNADPLDVEAGDVTRLSGDGQVAMLKATFQEVWEVSDSFAEALGMRPKGPKAGLASLLRAS